VEADQLDQFMDPPYPPDSAGLRDVVRRAAAGDRRAFADIVEEHHADMLRLAGVIVRDPDLAGDAVQLAWQRAWTRLRSLRDERRIRPWLLAIVSNECRQLLRHRRPTEQLTDAMLQSLPDPTDQATDPDLQVALDRLPPADRELLGLRYVLGFTSVELGKYLDLSPEGVRSRLKKLVDALRTELS
jgi:RNA polymerase sigma-70 factor (ECF subfamily)